MRPEVLAKALERTLELGTCPFPELQVRAVSFCGLGDQLLNVDVASYVRAVRDAGLAVAVNTNGALLDERRGRALIDAGVTWVYVNAGEIDDDHERTYGLPFEKVRENVARFAETAGGRCALTVVLVDHARDPAYVGVDPDRAAPPVGRPRIPVMAATGHGAEATCGHPGGCGAG